MRFTVIGVVIAGIAGLFAYAGGWLTPHALTPASMINTFEKVNGLHPSFRRNHAKGVCISGYFDSNGRGVALSKAAVFPSGRVPVIGRFSLAGGQPYVADAPHTIRGMAILFKLPDGEEWRTAMTNIPVFTVKTAQGFHDQLLASAPDPTTGKPDPAKMKTFLDALIASIHSHPLQWHLVVTIGDPGDPADDATIPWPPDRQQIDVGTLTIDHVESGDTSPVRDINLDPLVLPDGIATSDDPLLSARSAVYSQSFTRREGEPKEPSAVSTAETEK